MQEQRKVGHARIIGYAIGTALFVAVAFWKLIIR
jgi:hypothetical protein